MTQAQRISDTIFAEKRDNPEAVNLVFPARGVTFLDNPREVYEDLFVDDTILLIPVDDNEYDENAVKLVVEATGGVLGWMPAEINKKFREELRDGYQWIGKVTDVYTEYDTPGVRITPVLKNASSVKDSDAYAINQLVEEYGEEFREEFDMFFAAVRNKYGYPTTDGVQDAVSAQRVRGAVKFFFDQDQDIVFIAKFLSGVDGEYINECLHDVYATGVSVDLIPQNIVVEYDRGEDTVVVYATSGLDPFYHNGNPRSTLVGSILSDIIVLAFGEEKTYQFLPLGN